MFTIYTTYTLEELRNLIANITLVFQIIQCHSGTI